MKLRLSILAGLCAVFAGGTPSAHADGAGVSGTSGVHYYLSLGDSLADRGGNPEDYADKLYLALHASDPKLELVKLGCGGEGAQSMIEGSVLPSVNSSCGPPSFYLHRYPHKTQLAEAVAFLRAHAGKVSLVTIDIGGNDVQDCLVVLNFSEDCLNGDLPALTANLSTILAELRTAAGPDVPIVGMNYYDAFSGLWVLGDVLFGGDESLAQQLALASVAFVVQANDALEATYAAAGDAWADVETAFRTTDFTDTADLPGFGTVPVSVFEDCTLTHFCTSLDGHPNDAGYAVIAQAFAAALP